MYCSAITREYDHGKLWELSKLDSEEHKQDAALQNIKENHAPRVEDM
jgi:hypothetical protein